MRIRGLPVKVVRKEIKNLHLSVYPPHGHVRVSAPAHLKKEAIRLAVISRLPWIRKQLAKFENQVRQSERAMVTGESHFVQGRRHRLRVVEHEGPPAVNRTRRNTLELRVWPGTDRVKRHEILSQWYRELLRNQIPELIEKWEPVLGVQVDDWRIKRMKTRWGTCTRDAARIWLNLELAKKHPSCLEYIIVHEMAHLLETKHNDKFHEHLDRALPRWKVHRDELNSAPLAHERWKY